MKPSNLADLAQREAVTGLPTVPRHSYEWSSLFFSDGMLDLYLACPCMTACPQEDKPQPMPRIQTFCWVDHSGVVTAAIASAVCFAAL